MNIIIEKILALLGITVGFILLGWIFDNSFFEYDPIVLVFYFTALGSVLFLNKN